MSSGSSNDSNAGRRRSRSTPPRISPRSERRLGRRDRPWGEDADGGRSPPPSETSWTRFGWSRPGSSRRTETDSGRATRSACTSRSSRARRSARSSSRASCSGSAARAAARRSRCGAFRTASASSARSRCTRRASSASRSCGGAACGARSSTTSAGSRARRRGSRRSAPPWSPPRPKSSRDPAGVTPPSAPYRYEAQAWKTGVGRIAGVDEAGRGPLAGPVVAAAVVIAPDRRIKGLADSKLLLPEKRDTLFQLIQERAVSVGVGVVDHETIDRINILQATRRAMAEALARLAVIPELIITDFVNLPALPCPQRNLVAGDRPCASVAAASIVAKVTRDLIMVEADRQFPEYGFARHKGYATAEHLAALDRHGPCPIHRRTFAGVWRQGELFVLGEDD